MNGINLDAIMSTITPLSTYTMSKGEVRECMKEAIHQALVLATEVANDDSTQFILDVEKLII